MSIEQTNSSQPLTATANGPVVLNPEHYVEVGVRPPMDRYLLGIWKLRSFLTTQARYRSLSTGRGTLLGRIWLILQPFLGIGMYFVIFALLLKADRGIDNFIAFLGIGVIIFTPINGALSGGATLLDRNRSLLRGFAFPRASLVFSDSLRDFYDSIPDLLALLIFIVVIPPHVTPSWTWIMILPVIFLRQIFITGIIFFTARATAAVPDLKHVWPLFSRFWFYTSGVLFSLENFVTDPVALTILQANPAYIIIDTARDALMYGTVSHFSQWLQLIGWAIASFCIGLLVFSTGEESYNRVR